MPNTPEQRDSSLPDKTGGSPRIRELDAVRGLAAMMVLLCHLPRGAWFGETGVDLFFVLSGFLITGIIIRNRDRKGFLRTFYVRRALRIFPIYYLAIGVMLFINFFLKRHPGRLDGIAYYLVYLQHLPDYWGSQTPPVELSVGHTWTLAIEEQFYMTWPILILSLSIRKVRLLCLALAISPIVFRFFGISRLTLLGHTDGLALGGLLACLENSLGNDNVYFKRICTWLAGLGFAGYYFLWTYMCGHGITGKQMIASNAGIALISVAYFGLIGGVRLYSGTRALAPLRCNSLAHLGQISYGLYLYHWIIYELLDAVIKFRWQLGDPLWLDCLKIVVSLAVAYASWVYLERPILSLKDKVEYSADQKALADRARLECGLAESAGRVQDAET